MQGYILMIYSRPEMEQATMQSDNDVAPELHYPHPAKLQTWLMSAWISLSSSTWAIFSCRSSSSSCLYSSKFLSSMLRMSTSWCSRDRTFSRQRERDLHTHTHTHTHHNSTTVSFNELSKYYYSVSVTYSYTTVHCTVKAPPKAFQLFAKSDFS